MAHEQLIIREEPILIDEWLEVISKVPDLRQSQSDAVAIHPVFKAVVRVSNVVGDAEIFLADRDSWVRVFRFSKGKIIFKLGNRPVFILEIAHRISMMLDARIINEDGSFLNS